MRIPLGGSLHLMLPHLPAPNALQTAAEIALGALLRDAGLGPVVRREELKEQPFKKPREPMCVVVLTAGPAEIWLYDDTIAYNVGDKGDYLETLDYDSDTAIIESAAAAIRRALAT
jgi:hypothetical protein